MEPYIFIDEVEIEPLDKPTDVDIEPAITSVSASWNPVEDIDHFEVTVNGETFIQTTNNIRIDGLSPNTDYSFRLISVAGELRSPAFIGHFRTLEKPQITQVTELETTPVPQPSEPVLQPVHLWGISGGLVILILIIFLVLFFWDSSPKIPGIHNIL